MVVDHNLVVKLQWFSLLIWKCKLDEKYINILLVGWDSEWCVVMINNC